MIAFDFILGSIITGVFNLVRDIIQRMENKKIKSPNVVCIDDETLSLTVGITNEGIICVDFLTDLASGDGENTYTHSLDIEQAEFLYAELEHMIESAKPLAIKAKAKEETEDEKARIELIQAVEIAKAKENV